MLAARLDKKIQIKNITYTNTYGDLVENYANVITTMASITYNKTSNDDGVIYDVVNFYIRHTDNINYKSIIEYDLEKYRITTIRKIGRNEAISIDTIRIENQ